MVLGFLWIQFTMFFEPKEAARVINASKQDLPATRAQAPGTPKKDRKLNHNQIGGIYLSICLRIALYVH